MLKNIQSLLKKISEAKQTVDIEGHAYSEKEIIDFAKKYDPTIITLSDALKLIKNMRLHGELKRVVADKENGYVY